VATHPLHQRSRDQDIVSLSDYRFIGIFRCRDGKATAAVHVDREHPDELRSAEVPGTATYCCYVRDARSVWSCTRRARRYWPTVAFR
jgi:hypothetical protein